jgi:hypothetical protein
VQSGMDADRIKEFRDKVTFISGSSKNAGKTTFLNYLLPRLRREGEFAFLTIGIDGERKDQIFGTDKPVIHTEVGDNLLTCESMMNNSDGSFEILQVFPWKTVLGKLVFLKTLRSGLIELAGPENNDQLQHIIEFIKESAEIGTILIDGAVNRITQISSSKGSGFYYVSKIAPENYKSALERIRVVARLNEQKSSYFKLGQNDVYYHSGAFTEKTMKNLDDSYEAIVLDDFTKVFLSYSELQHLLKNFKLFFLNTIVLEAFVFNLYNIDRLDFLKELEMAGIKFPCIFNPYEREKGGQFDREII